MNDELKQLKKEMRRLRCPARVLEQVENRVRAEKASQPSGGHWAVSLGLVGAVAICVMVAVFQLRQEPVPVQIARVEISSPTDPAAVVEDARLTFAVFGYALKQAVDRSEPILRREVVTPLETQITAAKNKISDQL